MEPKNNTEIKPESRTAKIPVQRIVMSDDIKLYAWQPDGHGSLSFFVAAGSEAEARAAIQQHIADEKIDNYECGGWPSDFDLIVVDVGEVVTNDNS
jgi:hypothetical protein